MNSELMRQRIRNRLADLHLSEGQASVRAGLHRTTLSKFLKGDNKVLRDTAVSAISEILNCSPAFLRGETEDLTPRREHRENVQYAARQPSNNTHRMREIRTSALKPVNSMLNVPIIGITEAISFRPLGWYDGKDLGVIVNGLNPRFQGEHQYGFEVRGDDMDLAGIGDRDQVVCINPYSAGAEISDGSIVVVEHLSPDRDMREITLKELIVTDDEWVLQPRSSKPDYEPIRRPRSYDLSVGPDVRIIGIVISVVRFMPVKYTARTQQTSDVDVVRPDVAARGTSTGETSRAAA